MKSSRSLRLKKAEKEIRALGETRGVLTSCLISRGSALKRIAAVKVCKEFAFLCKLGLLSFKPDLWDFQILI